MNFDEIGNMTPADTERLKYNKLLDGFLRAIDKYAELSLMVRDEEIDADQLVEEYDTFLAPIATMLLMLDQLRGEDGIFARQNKMIDEQVANFRDQLDGM